MIARSRARQRPDTANGHSVSLTTVSHSPLRRNPAHAGANVGAAELPLHDVLRTAVVEAEDLVAQVQAVDHHREA